MPDLMVGMPGIMVGREVWEAGEAPWGRSRSVELESVAIND